MLGCGSNAPTLSCACFCECNSQQPRTKMGKRCAAASFRSRNTARRGYAGREQFPLLLQFFDPTAPHDLDIVIVPDEQPLVDEALRLNAQGGLKGELKWGHTMSPTVNRRVLRSPFGSTTAHVNLHSPTLWLMLRRALAQSIHERPRGACGFRELRFVRIDGVVRQGSDAQ